MNSGDSVDEDSGGTTRIAVGGERPYDVVVGHGLTDELTGALAGARQVGLVYAPPLERRAAKLAETLAGAGFAVRRLPVPDGEAAKDIRVAADCWDALAEAKFTRTDAVVGLGGGAVTDLAGFVAASWLRGVAVVQVPTTLLGMVDAAVGGKTGVNIGAGKNLVGAFHPPAAVICDMSTLDSLPPAELVPGMAEVVKAGLIADPAILDAIEADPVDAVRPGSARLREVAERAIRVKATVVSADLREAGSREFLNYGHTLGHAIEKREKYSWRHGAAVSVGLTYAAEIGRLSGRLAPEIADRHREILTSLGLPTSYPKQAWPDLLPAMRVDKKTRGATLRFVILDDLAQPAILSDPAPELLESAYARIADVL